MINDILEQYKKNIDLITARTTHDLDHAHQVLNRTARGMIHRINHPPVPGGIVFGSSAVWLMPECNCSEEEREKG